MSSDWFNQNRKDLIIVAITSQVPPKLKEDEILLSPDQQTQAGLPKTSIVKVTKIITIDQALVKKKLGIVSKKFIKRIKKLFISFIG